MLENGANACFVNQVNNAIIPLEHLTYNQYEHTINLTTTKSHFLLPKNIYPNRENAMGYDLGYKEDLDHINQEVSKFYNKMHKIGSLIDSKENINPKYAKEHYCPARFAEKFADITAATENKIKGAISSTVKEFENWSRLDVGARAGILRKIADLHEENKFELYSLIIKEAGKTINDAIGEVIE